jgi:predicted metal-dependent HD superfamily phosphohydrolase
MLHQIFIQLAQNCGVNPPATAILWQEIVQQYTRRHRAYHNLYHLEHLIRELEAVQSQVQDWSAVLWALFYHDLIYNPLKQNNEEKSAEKAVTYLTATGIAPAMVEKVRQIILATKGHQVSEDMDTNLFTDADLAILGKDNKWYRDYCKSIREEYVLVPDMLYKPGRRKVLQHFLAMERIYKTDYFFEKYEATARENLAWELALL